MDTCLRARFAPIVVSVDLPFCQLPRMQLFVVGSTNPVKIAAVRAVVVRVWPSCVVRGVAAESGVPAQPFGDEETQRGARMRAIGALTNRSRPILRWVWREES